MKTPDRTSPLELIHYRIFVLRECPDNVDEVDDKELKKYVEWAGKAAPN